MRLSHLLGPRPVALFAALVGGCGGPAPQASRPPGRPTTSLVVNDLPPLDRPLSSELRLDAVPLPAAVQAIRDRGGATVDLDRPALLASGIDPATPVTLRVRSATVLDAVTRVAEAIDGNDDAHRVAVLPSDDRRSVRLTSHRGLLATRVIREYLVGDLVGSDADAGHSLADVALYVRQNVDPTGWEDAGGDVGTMDADASRYVLRVVQTPANHRRITAVLAGLRPTGQGPPFPTTRP